MTLYYRTYSWGSQPASKVTDEEIQYLTHLVEKKNWRIVQLPNGYYQTEYLDPNKEGNWIDITRRETVKGAEAAIDASIEHYKKRLDFAQGPIVVKTFK
jgi:hypothetical protein